MIRTANFVASVSRNAGGLFESVRRLVQSLALAQMHVRVFGLLDEFSEQDLRAWLPVYVAAFRPTWPASFGYSPRLVSEVLSFQPDVVHNHGLWLYPSIAAYKCHNKTGKPYLISPHGMLDPWALGNSRWKKSIARVLYEDRHLQNARCLRALCEAEARAMRACGLRNEIAVIPNGIDLPAETPPGLPPWNGRAEPGVKILLYLGRIHPKKGLAFLLEGWASLRKTAGNDASRWVLCIAGWDQAGYEASLKRLATKLGLAWNDARAERFESGASILFLGPQFDFAKEACFAHCDAFVLPSLSEGVPMVVLEAWARSKATLMTPPCNLPDGFTAGAAMKIEANAESVAKGLRELMEMKDTERCAMGAKGRTLVAERFTWPHISNQMSGLYQWMLGSGAKPLCMADF